MGLEIKQIFNIEALLTTTFLIVSGLAAYVDFREKRLPDKYIAGLFIIASIAAFVCREPPFSDRIFGFAAVSIPMLLLTILVPGAFGGGDIKLTAACGLFLGLRLEAAAFFYALCTGSVYSLYLIFCKNKSKKEEFAFGPFLVFGVYLACIFPVF